MARSLNLVQLIGNLTRDPELRYTPSGTAVCTIGLATNRSWTTDTGEKKEEVEFHKIVVWNKLAELCAQLLSKGAKAYFKGRLTTRSYTTQDGQQKTTTEIVCDDMMVLSPKRTDTATETGVAEHTEHVEEAAKPSSPVKQEETKAPVEDVSPDDIPF